MVDELSEAQLDEFREAFNRFDKDGGGTIDASELSELMASVGHRPTAEELGDMIKLADADGTGDVDYVEFVTMMAHNMKNEKQEETLHAAFAVFDNNGDGHVDAEDMREFIVNVGEPATLEEVEALLRAVDTDR